MLSAYFHKIYKFSSIFSQNLYISPPFFVQFTFILLNLRFWLPTHFDHVAFMHRTGRYQIFPLIWKLRKSLPHGLTKAFLFMVYHCNSSQNTLAMHLVITTCRSEQRQNQHKVLSFKSHIKDNGSFRVRSTNFLTFSHLQLQILLKRFPYVCPPYSGTKPKFY